MSTFMNVFWQTLELVPLLTQCVFEYAKSYNVDWKVFIEAFIWTHFQNGCACCGDLKQCNISIRIDYITRIIHILRDLLCLVFVFKWPILPKWSNLQVFSGSGTQIALCGMVASSAFGNMILCRHSIQYTKSSATSMTRCKGGLGHIWNAWGYRFILRI